MASKGKAKKTPFENIKTHRPLMLTKVNVKVIEKLDEIASKNDGIAKWVIADSILSNALGIKPAHDFDVKKYLKK